MALSKTHGRHTKGKRGKNEQEILFCSVSVVDDYWFTLGYLSPWPYLEGEEEQCQLHAMFTPVHKISIEEVVTFVRVGWAVTENKKGVVVIGLGVVVRGARDEKDVSRPG